MAKFCLRPEFVDKFKQGLISREIDPKKLSEMTSQDRRAFLEKYVGKDSAEQTNALFESKLLLKNQKAGYITWAKKISGLSPQAKRDLISRIEKMDTVLNPADEKAFLHDLASQKLGVGVSVDEAKNISKLSQTIQEAQKLQKPDMSFSTQDQARNYAKAKAKLENYINELKGTDKLSIKSITDINGISKTARASLDDSAIFRQGWKAMLTHPITWGKRAIQSFSSIAKQFGGKNVMDEVKIDQYSRLNDLNGFYKKMDLAIFKPEEYFPSTLPEKIPLLGRFYKASDVGFTSFVYRLRMDLADKYIQIAQKSGVDLTDKELKSIGSMVNSLTGRANMGKLEGSATGLLNNVFFSVRNLKSQFDTLGHVVTGAGGSNFVRKQAAINLVKTISGIAAIMTTANALQPGSAETDPRSANFGKIKIGNTRFDITGGMSTLATLAARIGPLFAGQQALSKSSITGQLNPINSGKYGATTGQDVVVDYLTNKLSPVGQVVRDLLLQKDRNGNPLTFQGEIANLGVPLSGATYDELRKDPNSAPIILAMVADVLGIATNTYGQSQKKWASNPTKAQQAFKDKVGESKFKEANEKFDSRYNAWFQKITKQDSYKTLSNEAKQKVITDGKEKIKQNIFKEYKFKYKKQKVDKSEAKKIKKLLP